MENYQNILCATDFSENCKVAVERASDIARPYGTQLTLLHVVEYFPEVRSNVVIAPENADPASYREKQALASLAEIAQALKHDTVVQVVRFSTHSAKHEIIRFADEQNTDLIVIATHGRHGIASILGSTANGVMHSASCDVLVVRAKA